MKQMFQPINSRKTMIMNNQKVKDSNVEKATIEIETITPNNKESKMTSEFNTKQESKKGQSTTEVQTPSTELLELEKKIHAWNHGSLNIGCALSLIQEKKLYKQRGFSSFEKYCYSIFSISRSFAYALIDGSKVQDILKEANLLNSPVSERVLRPLVKHRNNVTLITSVWSKVISNVKDKTITSRDVIDSLKTYYSENNIAFSDTMNDTVINFVETVQKISESSKLVRLATERGKEGFSDEEKSSLLAQF